MMLSTLLLWLSRFVQLGELPRWCRRALGPDPVLLRLMPSRDQGQSGNTSNWSGRDAAKVKELLYLADQYLVTFCLGAGLDLTCPIKDEMPELLPAAGSVGEAGGDSSSRDGSSQQPSGGSLGSAAYQTLPQHNREYLKASYWDERFKHEEAYEWYADYRELREHLRGHLEPGSRVLILGCGNSSLAEDLYCDSLGVRDIVSMDISPTVIQHMGAQAAQRGHHELKWQVADMLQLPFADASFDVVLDKGTLDVLVVDADSLWDPQPSTKQRMFQAIDEVHRVLTPSGRLVSITFAQPHFRKPFLTAAKCDWHLDLTTVGEGRGFPYFIYALTRGQRLPDEQAVAFGGALNTPDAAPGSHVHEHMDNEDYLLSVHL